MTTDDLSLSLFVSLLRVKTMMKRSRQIDVTRALALAGTFTFLCSCARSCVLPFLTLYFRELGLTPAMTGVVLGSRHLVTLVWSPAAGLLSRHYNKRRAVISGSLVFSAAAALILLLVPSAGVHTQPPTCNTSHLRASPSQSLGESLLRSSTSAALTLQNPESRVTVSAAVSANRPGSQNISVDLGADSSSVPQPVAAPVRRRRSQVTDLPDEAAEETHFDFLSSLKMMDSQHQLFVLVLIIVSVWELLSAPLDWTADDGLYEYLDFADAADRYSGTGVWGLLGAACGAGGAGLLVSQLSCLIAEHTSRSVVHFYCYASAAALALPVAACLPLYLNRKQDRANRLLKAAQLVRGSPRALLCAVTTLLVGVCGSAVDNFLLWQMQDHGSDELHMGVSLAVALLSQAAFPLLAGRVSKLLSPGRILTVGAASLGLQCFYYSFLWGPWAVLPAQVLSCLSGGALWWAVNVQCEDVATPGAERSVSRVFGSLSLHLGRGVGSVAGGFVAQRLGLPWLFRGAAVALMLWSVCLPLLQVRAPRQRRINYSRLLAAASEGSDSESEQERDWLDKATQDNRSNSNYGQRRNQWNH